MRAVARYLDGVRQGRTASAAPRKYESRFHTLRHTEMFVLERRTVRLRDSVNEADRAQLLRQLDAMCSIGNQFNGFDGCSRRGEVEAVIASGEWGRYFDGVRVLPSDVVDALTNDQALESSMPLEPERGGEVAVVPQPVAEVYPFRERAAARPPSGPMTADARWPTRSSRASRCSGVT